MKRDALIRTRWAAVGATCAVALGAGGFGVVNAVFVPVSPIRVLDTRDSAEITNGTRRLVVEGAITVADGSSQLVVPSAASAVAINVTATSTRKNGGYGFVTVFPCVADSDAVPNASSLNFENGVDIANALSVTTSSNGSICLYVYGTADLIVDVAGYYVDHDHDDRYYTEAEVNELLADKLSTISITDASGREKTLMTSPWTLSTYIDVDGEIYEVNSTGFAVTVALGQFYFTQPSCQGDLYTDAGTRLRFGSRPVQLVAKELVDGRPSGTATRISFGSQTITASEVRSWRSNASGFTCVDSPTGFPYNLSEVRMVIWGTPVPTTSFTPPFRIDDGIGQIAN